MKKLALILLILFLTKGAYSDVLQLPFACYTKEIQAEFNKCGKKLDLSANDRTKESWGFLVSEGTSFKIYTYQPATQEDFEIVMKIIGD